MPLSLKVVTPERVVFEETVDSVTAMTEMGEVTILPNHVPLMATLKPGEMKLKTKDGERYLAASTGFLQVRPGNQVVILADTAERAEDLEVAAIETARERARELLSGARRGDEQQYAALAAAVEREVVRAKVARRTKHRSTPNPLSQS